MLFVLLLVGLTEAIIPSKTVCYDNVGCFNQTSPWFSITRPLPSPQSPESIDTRIYLYTRKSSERYNVTLGPPSSLKDSDFDPTRRTAFMTHGFASSGNTTWLDDLKNAYLKDVDANVFIVDWGKGASLINYLQVASNTRVVGVQVGRFLTELVQNYNVKPSKVHLMGHSLGAHTMGYVSKNLVNFTAPANITDKQKKLYRVGRITGFDPAQPGFELQPAEVRLDKEDGNFVDIVHSDAKPFLPLFGFGYISPLGDVDYYLNQGAFQPNCLDFSPIKNVTSILDLGKVPVEIISNAIGCSHGRSYEVFTSAVNPNVSCTFQGKRIISTSFFRDVGLFNSPIVAKSTCGTKDCVPLGLTTLYSKIKGDFQVRTSGKEPFCCRKYSIITGCSN